MTTTIPVTLLVQRPALDRLRLGALLTLAGGLGWVGGQYPWPGHAFDDQLAITAVHLLPLALVLVGAVVIQGTERSRGGHRMITLLACGVKVMTVVAVLLAVSHPDGFGPHTFLDWVPLGLANAGGGLWLLAEIRGRRSSRRGPATTSTSTQARSEAPGAS